jgi:hypothetical protein
MDKAESDGKIVLFQLLIFIGLFFFCYLPALSLFYWLVLKRQTLAQAGSEKFIDIIISLTTTAIIFIKYPQFRISFKGLSLTRMIQFVLASGAFMFFCSLFVRLLLMEITDEALKDLIGLIAFLTPIFFVQKFIKKPIKN